MNVLIINSAREWGGNELWSVSLANSLSEGHNIYFACRSKIFTDKLSSSVNIIHVPLKHELDITTKKRLSELIKSQNINLILSTKRKEYFIGGRLANKFGIPVIFRVGITRSIPRWDILQRYVYTKADAIIVNAGKIKEMMLEDKLCPAERIHVIYNGYEFPESFEKFTLPEEKKSFLFAAAGRLSHQKGYDLLLEAAAILQKKRDDFRIMIAGEGSAKEDYISYIKEHGLEDKVLLLGHVDNVRGFFEQADCIVIPSRDEGVPNTLFEAWSLKKAVITSNAAGLPEVVENKVNGLMTELDGGQLAGAMDYLLTNPEKCKEYGEQGHKLMNTNFTRSIMLEKIEALFTKLAGRS